MDRSEGKRDAVQTPFWFGPARDEDAARALKEAYADELYNACPRVALDAVVATAAYGWSVGISDDEVLGELALDGGGP